MVKKSELVFLSFLVLLGFLFLTQLTVTEQDFQPVDAVEYSRGIVGAFFVISTVILAGAVRKYRVQPKEAIEAHKKEATSKEKRLSQMLAFATFCIFLFYCLFFDIIGYYTTGFIVLVAYMHVLYVAQNDGITPKKSMLLVGLSLLITAGIYLVFSVAFELWLPRGFLI